jgi:hypothetical protein
LALDVKKSNSSNETPNVITVGIENYGLGIGKEFTKSPFHGFLAASTECSTGSNDHFVVVVGGGGVQSLVQFDGRPLGGASFQYKHCAITQHCNATITQPCT